MIMLTQPQALAQALALAQAMSPAVAAQPPPHMAARLNSVVDYKYNPYGTRASRKIEYYFSLPSMRLPQCTR
jgi:hypothetical protein